MQWHMALLLPQRRSLSLFKPRILVYLSGSMRSLLQRLCTQKAFPTGWTILTIALLCLPGSSIPGNGLFNIPHLDKVVHVILFGGIVLFWGGYYAFRTPDSTNWRKQAVIWTVLSIILGIVLEFVQFYCIPLRSFDRGDIVADVAGAITAFLFLLFLYPGRQAKGWYTVYCKKNGPCRNKGRNQN